jgi:transcription termination factor NusA
VIVPDDQLSLAIGRRGQNARLAARLTGWKIDIKSESEAEAELKEEIAGELFKAPPDETEKISESSEEPELTQIELSQPADLTVLDSVGPKTAALLKNAGFSTVESIARTTVEALTSVPGIGAKTAEKIQHSARAILSTSETELSKIVAR